jgi:hypothetical protein
MPLVSGTKLGRYEIRSQIGEGGMGEVYLAQDTELDRPVALKFLSTEVAGNQKRLNRFFQEAKAASALNHPNILTVYEIGRANDTNFFATEFVDGVTLRERMRSPMKLNAVLDFATQIASALVAAHAAGIVCIVTSSLRTSWCDRTFFMSVRSGKWTIWKVGIEGGPPVQVTDHLSQFPSISPDGKLLAYFYIDAQANDQAKLSIIPFDGGEPVKTIDLPRSAGNPWAGFVWTTDGRAIAYLDAGGSAIPNVWSQPIDGSAPKQLTNFKSEFMNGFAISRDGKQIAVTRATGTNELVLIRGFR